MKDVLMNHINLIKPNGVYNTSLNRKTWWQNRGIGHLFDEILTLIPSDIYSIKDCIHVILSDIEFPTCKECGTYVKFYDGCKIRDFCTYKCRAANKDVYGKYKKTNMERYGISSPFHVPQTRTKESYEKSIAKGRETILKRYGVDHNSKLRAFDINRLPDVSDLTRYEISDKYDVAYTTLNRAIRTSGVVVKNPSQSREEKFIEDILIELGVEYIKNDRTIINPLELDFVIPNYGVAIEVNGLYWHTDRTKPKDYHINKTVLCEDKGIQLIQFLDIEINKNPKLVKSMVLSKLGKLDKIWARKCVFGTVDSKVAANFHRDNHISGHSISTQHYGLYYNNDLLTVLSFARSRFNKKSDLELIRFSTKIGLQVVGGFSKMVTNSGITSFISYADRRFSGRSNVYDTNGMKLIGTTQPNYFYTKDHRILLSRHKYQKSKLTKFDNYSESKSERQIMSELGFERFYDCGSNLFIYGDTNVK